MLQYRGPMDHYKDDLDRIYASEGTHVLDANTPGLLLVEGDANGLQKLVESMPGWKAYAQQYYDLPEQRPQVKQYSEVENSPSSDAAYQGEQMVQASPTPPPSDPSPPSAQLPKSKKPKSRKKINK